jgi:uncharacterized membrane protein
MSGLNPLYGVAIANATALVVTIFFVLLSGRWRQLKAAKRYGLFFTILAGISNTIAILSLYWAMSIGEVAVVVPVTCIYPLFTLLVAYFFMKESEGLDLFTVTGTFLIVTGIILTI